MGGLVGGLFGSKGKSSQVVDVNPEAFANLAPGVAQQISQLFSTQGGPAWPGPFSAPMSGQETSLMNNVFGQAQQPGPGASAAMPLLQQIMSGQLMQPGSNPYLQASIESAQRPLLQQYQEQILPQIQGQFTRAGQFIQPGSSSPFDRAAAISGRGLMDALGDVSTRMTSENFAAERSRQLPAAQMAAGLDAQQLESTIQGLQAVALPRMIQEMGIERGIQEFQRRISTLMQALQMGVSAAQPNAVMMPGQAGQPGLLSGLLGGMGGSFGTALGARIPLPF